MRTPEEIKKGLECCVSNPLCHECPYYNEVDCNVMERDAFAYIQQLEEDRKERDILADAYQQLEAAQPKWISVKERLPDDLEEVLILVKETEFYGQYKELSKSYFCQYIGCVDDGEWFTVWCHGHRYIKDTAKEPCADKLEVTHWMPLPEPPKGDA